MSLKLEDLEVYQLSMDIADEIYEIIDEWGKFQKWTTGKQLIEAADSIAANISEGFGRYFFKENRQFQFYARGSLSETKTWITKAHRRKLITGEKFSQLSQQLELLGKKHNNYIKSIGSTPKMTNDQ